MIFYKKKPARPAGGRRATRILFGAIFLPGIKIPGYKDLTPSEFLYSRYNVVNSKL